MGIDETVEFNHGGALRVRKVDEDPLDTWYMVEERVSIESDEFGEPGVTAGEVERLAAHENDRFCKRSVYAHNRLHERRTGRSHVEEDVTSTCKQIREGSAENG